MKDVLALTAGRTNAQKFFGDDRVEVYSFKPLADGATSVVEVREEIAALIAGGIKFVVTDDVHNIKPAIDVTDEEFWPTFLDLDDDAYSIVCIDVRAYENLICDRSRNKGHGHGFTDFTQFFRPGDVYLKSQLSPELHEKHPQLLFFPYVAPYAPTFAYTDKELYDSEEQVLCAKRTYDVGFFGALTHKDRNDVLLRLKDRFDVHGGITDMEKVYAGRIPDKYKGCDLSLSVPRLGGVEYISSFYDSKLALSVRGLGKHCIRMFEAMATKTACLSDSAPLENMWLVKPRHCVEAFFFDGVVDVAEVCGEALENPKLVDDVARRGFEFWKKYHSPRALRKFGDLLLELDVLDKEGFYTKLLETLER